MLPFEGSNIIYPISVGLFGKSLVVVKEGMILISEETTELI